MEQFRYSKEQVQCLVNECSQRVCFLPGRGRSEVWKGFSVLAIDGEVQDFSVCNNCKTVVTWRPRDGTTGLRKHSCAKLWLSRKGSKNSGLEASESEIREMVAVVDGLKNVLEDAAFNVCLVDGTPAEVLGGAGFLDFVRRVYDLGAQHGIGMDLNGVLPEVSAVARRLEKMAACEEIQLVAELENVPSFGVSLDLSFRAVTTTTHLTISVHYIVEDDESLFLKHKELCTCEINEGETEDHIKRKIKDALKHFKAWRKNNVYVTAKNSSAVNPKIEKTVHCTAYNINLALQKTFDGIDNCEFPELFNLIKASGELASYVNSTGLCDRLEGKPLKRKVPTSWKATSELLKSIDEAKPELEAIFDENTDARILRALDFNLLQEFVILLKSFEEAIRILSSSKMSTLPLVLPAKIKLEKCLSNNEGDSDVMRKVKGRMAKFLDEHMKIDSLHYVATMLHPKMKWFVKKNLGDCAHESARNLIAEMMNVANISKTEEDEEEDLVEPERVPFKKPRLEQEEYEFLSEVMSDNCAADCEDNSDEMPNYLESKIPLQHRNPFIFWKKSAILFPRLSQVARSVLCVPATAVVKQREEIT